jgi:hypothetical protein
MSMVEGAAGTCSDSWADVPRMFRQADGALPSPWQDLFGPLRQGLVDGLVVVGQFGQSIDARIATASGDSRYINGAAGLAHLHRLRALMDAVLIGVGTANMDDPQLTVRRVSGPSPARVIVDPTGRLPATARVLMADGIRRLVITRAGAPNTLPHGVEVAGLPDSEGQIAPAPGRRRRQHGLTLFGGALPRPPACGDRTHHYRGGTIKRDAAPDRPRGACAAGTDPRPCSGR